MIFLPIIVFGFGLIIGSFLNVVILRLNTGRSIVKGRSSCARCNKKLSWYELIPVFSFLGLRGKCSSCKDRISFQYPVVELLTAITFVILYTKLVLVHGLGLVSVISFIGSLTIASMMIVILFYDIKHKIIPDKVVIPFIFLSIFSVFWHYLTSDNFPIVTALLSGPILSAPFFFIWLISKGKGMGFGDVKLALGMGWLLGLAPSLALFFFSFWIGAIVGLLLIASSTSTMKSEIPFAPFMIISLFIVSVFGITLNSFFSIWL